MPTKAELGSIGPPPSPGRISGLTQWQVPPRLPSRVVWPFRGIYLHKQKKSSRLKRHPESKYPSKNGQTTRFQFKTQMTSPTNNAFLDPAKRRKEESAPKRKVGSCGWKSHDQGKLNRTRSMKFGLFERFEFGAIDPGIHLTIHLLVKNVVSGLFLRNG